MATIEQIEAKLTALLVNINPQQRRNLAKKIGMQLRKSQSERIAKQQNPDGSAYEPRKVQRQAKRAKGRVKRKAMFAKLRTARFLKVWSNSDEISVGYAGNRTNTAYVASVHQYGLTVKIGRNLKKYKYPQRELLGFTDKDLEMIEELVVEQLAL